MIRNLLAACCAPLMLAACAWLGTRPAGAPPPSSNLDGAVSSPAADAPGTFQFVEAIQDYAKPRDVPAAFQHLVDWHAGMGNVVLLVTAGGRRACAIPPAEATRVLVHQRYRCRWSAAR